jgi:hypothetical protein
VEGDGMRIEGILYKFIIKGIRRKDNFDGLYKQQSPLIYGWAKLDTLNTEFPEWAWSYEWEEEDGKTKRLGRGWQRKPIWSAYPGGVKAWVEALAGGEIFPRHKSALEAVFPQAMPVERRADEIESWKRQVVAQEESVVEDVEYLQTIEHTSPETFREKLDALFPQFTHSCSAYSGCPMADICWNLEIGRDPIGCGLYETRNANHPEHGGNGES